VFPTRMALNNLKLKLASAQKGHSLLKRKSDALSVRFRQILQRIHQAKTAMGASLRQAYFGLAEVNYAAGDISFAVRERVQGGAAAKVRARMENVSGVQLPVFQLVSEGSVGSNSSGAGGEGSPLGSPNANQEWLGRGGQQVARCRDSFTKTLAALVELASLQTAFFVLDEVIRVTNRRVNALEYVMIPRLEATINYISSELDEQDREDFFRLKKVQNNKKKHAEIEEALELEMSQLKMITEGSPKNLLSDMVDQEIFV